MLTIKATGEREEMKATDEGEDEHWNTTNVQADHTQSNIKGDLNGILNNSMIWGLEYFYLQIKLNI